MTFQLLRTLLPRTPRWWAVVPVIAIGLVGAGCDSGSDSTRDSDAADSLTITLEDLTLSPPRVETWLLECGPPGGSLEDAAGACERLVARSAPFAEPEADEVCTEIFGGPQTLTIRGDFAGKPIDRTFGRANGCQINRFDQIVATLGITELIG